MLPPPYRQYHEQLLEMDSLRSELHQSQSHQRDEEQRYSKIRLQMRVKERLRHDLGGLTDTVVRRGLVCTGNLSPSIIQPGPKSP